MTKSITTVLSLSEFFYALSDEQLERIAAICEPMTCQKEDVLIRENDAADKLYVIGDGRVQVLMNPTVEEAEQGVEPTVVTELMPGQAFGEMALVDQGIRSATIQVSQDDTFVLRISGKRLMALCDQYPSMGYQVMKNLAADLALKIRIANLSLRQYQVMLSKNEP